MSHVKTIRDTPKRGITYTRRPGAYVILPIGDGILLTYQDGDEREFQLPGGGVDAGTSIPALHREVIEETGWIISAPRRLGAYKRFVFMPEYDLWAEKDLHNLRRACYRLYDPLEKDHSDHILSIPLALEVMPNDADRDYIRAYFDF